MNGVLTERVISKFELTDEQQQAAVERNKNVVVTAGAGSGKTRTLVARYVSLLAEGLEPRRVVAITFTEKAAREMRSRARKAISELIADAHDETERRIWEELSARMDSARIGTIHSLCAEILRAHPAEAGIDPRFDVLDEGLTAVLRAQVVEETLHGFVADPDFVPLFTVMGTGEIYDLMQFLIKHRLDASESFADMPDGRSVVQKYLQTVLSRPDLADAISDLRAVPSSQLQADKLYDLITGLLTAWEHAETALRNGDVIGCAQALYQACREYIKLNVGKRDSRIKDILRDLKVSYDELVDPIVGGAKTNTQPDPKAEESLVALESLLPTVFERLLDNYRAALNQRQALDFDDLEAGTEKLLAREDILAALQGELDALLVDEFQDTNTRQQRIVEALAGSEPRLFVVGDDRQSIYRFRRADVRVFRALRRRIEAEDGLVVNLNKTYRAHETLLNTTSKLLSAIMGTTEKPFEPYYVPFSELDADRKTSLKHTKAPYVEFVFGAGEDASDARPVMARALARRLQELKEDRQIVSWDDVVLLFRASSGFVYYENAFEEMQIPFVTVAGRGFYDRPEIRDVLNILRALADPTDDLSMAGLLRSPAFGLTDAALYFLRKQGDNNLSYWQALQGDLTCLEELDQQRATRTVEILSYLLPEVDRVPVAELLKQFVDMTDYRAILASEGESSTGGRLWRNLDKLLADAYASRQVIVRDFLDYLDTVSDAGAREGEAPADAQGAVRLMTIHKAKGLEFRIVVLADAARETPAGKENAYLLPEVGLAVKVDPPPMLFRLAKHEDRLQNEAESRRTLYVALTRAQEKLIISGHLAPTGKGEWLGKLIDAAGLDTDALLGQAGIPVVSEVTPECPIWAIAYAGDNVSPSMSSHSVHGVEDISNSLPLFRPLAEAQPVFQENDEPDENRAWRATGSDAHIPPGVIGQMVHKAIELWRFPEDARLIPVLETAALNAGLTSSEQQVKAVRRAVELLGRLRAHPLWEEINSAKARYHELPYSRMNEKHSETGYIDLLYCDLSGWQIVDFKTDSISSTWERDNLIALYGRQMNRYFGAVQELLGQQAQLQLCFLDDRGSVNIVKF
jgi:ATP-dependent helicase/nuclease subunit A